MRRAASRPRPANCMTWLLLATPLTGGLLQAATPLEELRYSPDVTVTRATQTVQDHDVASDDLSGVVTLLSLGVVPASTDIDAYHRLDTDELVSFDTTVDLPGGTVASGGDIVRFDGSVYTIEFDSQVNGVPLGVDVDAVSLIEGDLLLSFDVAVELDGVTFHDEDLARFDGFVFSLFFDGSSAGLSPALALDAAHHLDCNGHLLLSLDGGGSVGGVTFDDDDVLEYDPDSGTWSMAYDGSAALTAWRAADIDAIHGSADPGPGPATLFGQTIEAQADKIKFTWPNAVDYIAVRGEFVTSTDIGSYAIDWISSGSGSAITDPDTPTANRGFWYLVKLGGCELRSWQTTLGTEPGRDTTLP